MTNTLRSRRLTDSAKLLAASALLVFGCKNPANEAPRGTAASPSQIAAHSDDETTIGGPRGVNGDCFPPGANCADHGRIAGVCDLEQRCVSAPPVLHEACPDAVVQTARSALTSELSARSAEVVRAVGAGTGRTLYIRGRMNALTGEAEARLISGTCLECNNGVIPVQRVDGLGRQNCIAGVDIVLTPIPVEDARPRDAGELNGVCPPEITQRLSRRAFAVIASRVVSLREAANSSDAEAVRVIVSIRVSGGIATTTGIRAASMNGSSSVPPSIVDFTGVYVGNPGDCVANLTVTLPPG